MKDCDLQRIPAQDRLHFATQGDNRELRILAHDLFALLAAARMASEIKHGIVDYALGDAESV